jgi:hypothetical protein
MVGIKGPCMSLIWPGCKVSDRFNRKNVLVVDFSRAGFFGVARLVPVLL